VQTACHLRVFPYIRMLLFLGRLAQAGWSGNGQCGENFAA
jgi:hypothetical protein